MSIPTKNEFPLAARGAGFAFVFLPLGLVAIFVEPGWLDGETVVTVQRHAVVNDGRGDKPVGPTRLRAFLPGSQIVLLLGSQLV